MLEGNESEKANIKPHYFLACLLKRSHVKRFNVALEMAFSLVVVVTTAE